jgi:hypothetical protein
VREREKQGEEDDNEGEGASKEQEKEGGKKEKEDHHFQLHLPLWETHHAQENLVPPLVNLQTVIYAFVHTIN